MITLVQLLLASYESFIADEIKANPLDVRLRTSLLSLYHTWGKDVPSKLKDAYTYGWQVEARKPFLDSRQWYETLASVTEVSFHRKFS